MNRLFGRNILSVLEDAVGIFSPAIQGLVGNERAVDLALARLVCDSDLGKLLNIFDANPQPDKHLLWNLSESDVREALDPLNEGVLDFAWLATGVPSQTPPLHEMFRICASLHSWLCLDEENIALVLGNRLRISMVVACYLRYIRVVESVSAGFNAFCRRLGGIGLPGAPRRSPVEGLPPSVRTFFQNFNGLVETERWPSTKPLLLKNVLVDGVPVDDLPCLDIFDHNGLIFESHDHEKTHQWQEDSGQGVYHVERVLTGDFYVSCRFGGEHARDTRAPRNYLFRYSNSARFLAVGEIGLGVDKVDIREYRNSFEDEGFSMALIFEDAEEASIEGPIANLGSPSRSRSIRPIPDELPVGPCALKMGLIELSMHHIVAPSAPLVHKLCEMGFDRDACRIALQLSNNNEDAAAGLALTISNLFADMPRGGKSPAADEYSRGSMGRSGARGNRRRHTMLALPSSETLESADSEDLAELDAAFSEISAFTGLQMDDLKRLVSDSVQSPGGRYVPPNTTVGDGLLRGVSGGKAKVFRDIENSPSFSSDDILIADPKGGHVDLPNTVLKIEAIPDETSDSQEEMEAAAAVAELPALAEQPEPSESSDDAAAEAIDIAAPISSFARSGSEVSGGSQESDDSPLENEEKAENVTTDLRATSSNIILPTTSEVTESQSLAEGLPDAVAERKSETVPPPSPAQLPAAGEGFDTALLKYRLMLRTGSAPGKVAEAMGGDGLEPSLIGLESSDTPVRLPDLKKDPSTEDDPKFADFMRMMKTRAADADGAEDVASSPAVDRTAVSSEEVGLTPVAPDTSSVALKDHPTYSKYFKMLQCGVPEGAVALKMESDGLDAKVLGEDPDKLVPIEGPESQTVGGSSTAEPKVEHEAPLEGESKDSLPAKHSSETKAQPSTRPALKDDPKYAKYLKMLRTGVPRAAVEHRMRIDHADTSALDADPEEPFGEDPAPVEAAVAVPSAAVPETVPLKEDPRFAKYFKMLKSGVPRPAVEHRMQLDGVDTAALDADADMPFGQEGQGATASGVQGPPLKDDPTYSKYFKMLKSGVPRPAVEHRMQLDGVDIFMLDADPDQPLPGAAVAGPVAAGPALKDDPRYAKYFKMLKSGVPRGAVEHRLQLDGLDTKALDADPERPFGNAPEAQANRDAQALKDDARYQKYFKMIKSGVPKAAVAHKMQSDGLDPRALDADPNLPFGASAAPSIPGPPLKDDPKYAKYLKMLKSGVPKAAVAHKMRSDGLDPAALDADPEKPFGVTPQAAASATPLKDDPKYAKYLKMVKSGVPKPAVAHKMKADGLDPAALDADPNLPFGATSRAKSPSAPKKSKKRRKRLHWQAVDQKQLESDSIWLSGNTEVQNLDLKLHDFESLFVQSHSTKAKPRKAAQKAARKQQVALIDGRRATNAGIAIARIKLTYAQMREKITNLEDTSFSTVQMRTLQTFLPTPDEIQTLKGYKGDLTVLNEAEKFMMEMIDLDQGHKRLEAMIYKAQFAERIQQVSEDIRTIEKACDDIKLSDRLRKTLKIILQIGNAMNEGEATAFSLDALSKLSSSKAFDNKTTVLDYIVMVVKRNEEDLLDLADDLKSVQAASRVLMDTLTAELQTVFKGIEGVEIFVEEAEEAFLTPPPPADNKDAATPSTPKSNSSSKSTPSSLEKMRTQKTSMKRADATQVMHFNQGFSEDGSAVSPDWKMGKGGPVGPRSEVGKFVERARRILERVQEECALMNDKYQSVLSYLGERRDRKSHDFFNIFNNFIREYQFSRQRVERQMRSAARTRRIEKAKKERERRDKEKNESAADPSTVDQKKPETVEEHAQAAGMEYAKMVQKSRNGAHAKTTDTVNPSPRKAGSHIESHTRTQSTFF